MKEQTSNDDSGDNCDMDKKAKKALDDLLIDLVTLQLTANQMEKEIAELMDHQRHSKSNN